MSRNPEPPSAASRTERALAGMAAAVVGLSVLAIAAVLVASLLHVPTGQGLWVPIALLPLLGLPIGFLLLVAFIVVGAVRRSRAARRTP